MDLKNKFCHILKLKNKRKKLACNQMGPLKYVDPYNLINRHVLSNHMGHDNWAQKWLLLALIPFMIEQFIIDYITMLAHQILVQRDVFMEINFTILVAFLHLHRIDDKTLTSRVL